jgi:hypothetical protein
MAGKIDAAAGASGLEKTGPKVTPLFRPDPPPLSAVVELRNVYGHVVRRIVCDDAEAASHWDQHWWRLP